MAGCCQLVGNLNVGDPGIISVQVRSDTEMSKAANSIIVGPTIGSVTISAYATKELHLNACPGRAGVSINWIRKYDCDSDQVHFLFAGAGKSYISGDVENLASIPNRQSVVTYGVVNASAASGPTALYEKSTQTDGYGLVYAGAPFSFSTNDEGAVIIPFKGINVGNLYLQNFSLQCTPGQVPTATYSLLFVYSNS